MSCHLSLQKKNNSIIDKNVNDFDNTMEYFKLSQSPINAKKHAIEVLNSYLASNLGVSQLEMMNHVLNTVNKSRNND